MAIHVTLGGFPPVRLNTAEGAALSVIAAGPAQTPEQITDGPRASWQGDTSTEDHEVTVLVCQAWGVPCRSLNEFRIEAYGGSADRPSLFLGSDVYPADYLD